MRESRTVSGQRGTAFSFCSFIKPVVHDNESTKVHDNESTKNQDQKYNKSRRSAREIDEGRDTIIRGHIREPRFGLRCRRCSTQRRKPMPTTIAPSSVRAGSATVPRYIFLTGGRNHGRATMAHRGSLHGARNITGETISETPSIW